MTELEISGYVSDGDDIGDSMSSSRLDSESFSLHTGEGSKRSVSDWVRSAHAMLQTPQKPFDRQSKTPEDSAKKRRKFQRFECFSYFKPHIRDAPIQLFPLPIQILQLRVSADTISDLILPPIFKLYIPHCLETFLHNVT